MIPARSAAPDLAAERDALVWRALADPTRRALLDRLRAGPATAGTLAEGFAMSRFGVRKHVAQLVEAGLVLVEERGRERWHRLNPAPIRAIYRRWIRPFEEAAGERVLEIQERAERRARKAQP
jgi:DNA-binding transcriptional ArsR family regulator